MPKNWEARERKQNKKKTGMVVTNRSLKSVILPVIAKKAKVEK